MKNIQIYDKLIENKHLGNWTEDYSHENGNYLCKCFQCNENFVGHKRRIICKKCFDKNQI